MVLPFFLKRWESWRNQFKVFSTVSDVILYRRVCNSNILSQPFTLRIREAGGNPLWVRPGTTDLKVLWDTFHYKYHLPPIQLKSDCIIVDLGANVGYTVAHFAYLYPDSYIVAVEMDKENYEIATKNIKYFGQRCCLKHAAVWSNAERVSYDADGEWGFHIVNQVSNSNMNYRSTKAQTIADIFEEHKLTLVDYLKMDIEGSEAEILKDPKEWLNSVQSIKIEVHPQFNPDATMENCSEILKSYGFRYFKDRNHPKCLIAIR
jgi:FkbM family methyltransferase